MHDMIWCFQEDIKDTFRQLEENIWRNVKECTDYFIKDMKPSGAFLRIKEVNDACTAPLDAILAEIAAHLLPLSANKMTPSPTSRRRSHLPLPPPPYFFLHGQI